MRWLKLSLLLVLLTFACKAKTARNFIVDYDHNTFLKDGKPFRYISGCMHYFRVLRYYWRDRLAKMKACGLDAVETYIPWNFHWLDHSYNFDGQRDIGAFLQMIQDEGLLAIIRGFPYSDTEWDMGGLPSWLLNSKYNTPEDPIVLRTSDPKFVAAVQDWLDVILPILKPFLYNNGGPIIMLQVENEYGSYYAKDAAYLKILAHDIDSRLDKNVVLFTTDGNSANDLEYGRIDSVFQTVDFGPGTDVNASFTLLRKYQTNGPLVNSEFYTGWLDHWGERHHRTSSEVICKTFEKMLDSNASVNFYMFTGGTNFGYWSGSNGPKISQVTTSYDYDSPISENGDTTEKYFRIRDVISKYKQVPPMPVPANISTISYGSVELLNQGTFWDHLQTLCPNGPVVANSPLSFEDLNILGGYVLYRTKIPPMLKIGAFLSHFLTLVVENSVRDAARVYINQDYVGELNRGSHVMVLGFYNEGDEIDLLVESKGRVSFGTNINDSKGISGNVKLVGITGMVWLADWEIYPLTLENLNTEFDVQSHSKVGASRFTPAIFSATISTSMVADTFLDFSGGNWTSGYVLANGFNLGKFEPRKGPQKTLYLPTKSILKDGHTLNITVFETSPGNVCSEKGHSCTIKFVDKPHLG